MRFFLSERRNGLLFLIVALLIPGLFGCGSDDHGESLLALAPPPTRSEPNFSNLSVYKASSPRADVLLECAKADTIEESCLVGTLPLLGSDAVGPIPSVDEIMDRVVVSHPWMGDRFREILLKLRPDVRTLLRNVTVIVIDDDIRPSFYWTLTGAIYLDPDFLWLTPAEEATVSRQPDYRSDFVRQLIFRPLWRYTLNNDYASGAGDQTGRSLTDILFDVAALLYHELAHANDFLPPERSNSLDPTLSIIENLARIKGSFVSEQLMERHALTSNVWPGLAQVIYRGERATGAQRSLAAPDAGVAFEQDRASDAYAYVAGPEDVAMLFEEVMMKFNHNLERDIAFVSWPTTMDYVCDDFIVGWGYRNRIADPSVRLRADFIVSKLLPGSSATISSFLSRLPPPTPLPAGRGWCSSINPTGTPSPLALRGVDMRRQLLRDLSPPHER